MEQLVDQVGDVSRDVTINYIMSNNAKIYAVVGAPYVQKDDNSEKLCSKVEYISDDS